MLVLIPQIYVKERSDIQLFMDCIYVPSQHSTEESEEHIPPKEMEAFEMLVCCQHVVSQISFQASLGGRRSNTENYFQTPSESYCL